MSEVLNDAIKHFRRKVFSVEAMHYSEATPSVEAAIIAWLDGHHIKARCVREKTARGIDIAKQTWADPGDWIVVNQRGQVSALWPETLAHLYEEITPPAPSETPAQSGSGAPSP